MGPETVFMYPFVILVLGDDGAVGAGVAAGTAVQAGTGIDDVTIIALRDSTHGTCVRASTAADASGTDLISHGKHLHQNCTPIVAYKLKKASTSRSNSMVKFSKKYGKASKNDVCQD